MKIISITGTASDAGKTTVASFVLRNLRERTYNSDDKRTRIANERTLPNHRSGWGALKITVRHEGVCPRHTDCETCDDGYGPYKILVADEIINEEGKDTDRLSKAGATKVVWLQTDSSAEKVGLEAALACFNKEDVLIVEGNSFLRIKDAVAAIMVISPSVKKMKKSAKLLLDKINIVAINAHTNHTPKQIEECKERLFATGCKAEYFVINPYCEDGYSNQAFIDKIQECFETSLIGSFNDC